eukprot:1161873-Pelagomonas_calceolata.AAC.4
MRTLYKFRLCVYMKAKPVVNARCQGVGCYNTKHFKRWQLQTPVLFSVGVRAPPHTITWKLKAASARCVWGGGEGRRGGGVTCRAGRAHVRESTGACLSVREHRDAQRTDKLCRTCMIRTNLSVSQAECGSMGMHSKDYIASRARVFRATAPPEHECLMYSHLSSPSWCPPGCSSQFETFATLRAHFWATLMSQTPSCILWLSAGVRARAAASGV